MTVASSCGVEIQGLREQKRPRWDAQNNVRHQQVPENGATAAESPGRPFKPGMNSQTSETFRRGPDRIPRGTITSLYRTVWDDDGDLTAALLAPGLVGKLLPARRALARAMIRGANGTVGEALKIAETIADRLEGRPVQKVAAEGSHLTVFYKTGDPPPPWLQGTQAASRSTSDEEPSQGPPNKRPAWRPRGFRAAWYLTPARSTA
jgi:hypothetical protein